MKNRGFHFRLRKLKTPSGQRLTVGRLATAIYVSRSALVETLNNKPGRGKSTRPRVTRFLKEHYPLEAEALIQALGWSE